MVSAHAKPEAPPPLPVCPVCGAALEWADEHTDTGIGTPVRWLGTVAECDCGLEMRWYPNVPWRRKKRAHAAAMLEQDEEEAGQLTLIGG